MSLQAGLALAQEAAEDLEDAYVPSAGGYAQVAIVADEAFPAEMLRIAKRLRLRAEKLLIAFFVVVHRANQKARV